MAYPSSLDTFTDPAGTDLVSTDDHAGMHTAEHTAIKAIEAVVGTTAGTNVLKNFSAGNFPARINSSNVLQQALQGTINTSLLGTPNIANGTITGGTINTSIFNAGTLGTPTLSGSVIVSGTATPVKIGNALAPSVVTVTDVPSGTVVPNASAGQVFSLTLGTTAGNRTLGNPINATDGQVLSWRVKQNANSTGTILYESQYTFSDGTANAYSIGTTASKWNYFNFRYNALGTQWDDQGNLTNI